MSVQAQLRAPRRVAANFDEQRTEVRIINVEIVVVDVDRLVAVELKLPVDFLPVESLRLLLGHPDEDNSVPHLPLPSEIVGDVVLPFFVLELVDGYPFSLRLRLHRLAESLRYLSQHYRRRNRFLQLASHEAHQAPFSCQLADIAGQIETIEAPHFQCYVPVQ